MADQTILIENEFYDAIMRGTVSNEDEKAKKLIFLQQPDGTMRQWSLQIVRDPNGRERIVFAEDDGTPRGQLILWDPYTANAQVRAAAEPSGEMMQSLYGYDPVSGFLNSFGVEGAVLGGYQRIIDPRGTAVPFTPVLLPLAATTHYTVGVGKVAYFEVEFSNASGSNEDIDLWIVENGGAAGNSNKRLNGYPLRATDFPFRMGGYNLEAGGFVRTASTNGNRISMGLALWERDV